MAASPPPEAGSSASLPVGADCLCLHEIFDRVPCTAADRHRACTALSEAEAECPPALPWLLLPAPDRHGTSATRVVCVHSGYRVHHHRQLPFLAPGARCFGAHDGAWLFVHDGGQTYRHELVNLRTGDAHGLPGRILVFADHNQTFYYIDTTIHAAALSSSPDSADCFAVFIATSDLLPPHRRFLAIWRNGWALAAEIRPPGVEIGRFPVQDVAYHRGGFHLLHIHVYHTSVFTIQQLQDGDYRVGWEHRLFLHPGASMRIPGHFVRSRYLVSSRGDLLLVVRFSEDSALSSSPDRDRDTQTTIHAAALRFATSKFKVFRATQRPHQVPEADPAFPVALYRWEWSELDTLDGRILFVGYGCSRSYEADRYSGFNSGIYFFDDEEHHFVDDVQYPCRDNGWWSESDDRVELCFPPADPSWISHPAWILP